MAVVVRIRPRIRVHILSAALLGLVVCVVHVQVRHLGVDSSPHDLYASIRDTKDNCDRAVKIMPSHGSAQSITLMTTYGTQQRRRHREE